jgi:hypothetical protein
MGQPYPRPYRRSIPGKSKLHECQQSAWIFFLPRRDDGERARRRRLLQIPRDFPRCVHPSLARTLIQQKDRRGIGMDRRNVRAGIGGQEAENQMLAYVRNGLCAAVAYPFSPDSGKEHERPAVILGKPGPDRFGALVVVGLCEAGDRN